MGRRGAPDDEGLLVVALRSEGDDVVGALQLREGVAAGVPPQLHAAAACLAVHHPCAHSRTLESGGNIPCALFTANM